MKIQVLVEDAGTNWAAASDDDVLEGVIAATGDTREAAIDKFRSALRFHLNYLRSDGKNVPEIEGLEIRELVSA